ncbi:DedA family protein [Paenisporosarcina sp. TG20]|uniref:DedA family protein n=1 Tax=Paenisporosarcina sp. TG20 TaxID=1211706 RepID=UPI0002F44679|nr:DedA family protein [Paenisporosarcina sp. TG20]
MDLTILFELVQSFGYLSMFLFSWLLLFGLPIPNEVAASFIGVLTEVRGFNPIYSFISGYLGLISATFFAYFIGRILGPRLIHRISKTRLNKPINAFKSYLEKHGNTAIGFSFFLPGIRWAMPYVVGSNQFPLKLFVKYSIFPSFLWMLIYFQLGRTFPYAYTLILEHLQLVLISVSLLIVFAFIIRYFVNQRRLKKRTN